MRFIAALPVLGLLLMPLQANAACSFLPPVGGGDPIVKKKVERPKGLIGKAIGRTNWDTDFVVSALPLFQAVFYRRFQRPQQLSGPGLPQIQRWQQQQGGR